MDGSERRVEDAERQQMGLDGTGRDGTAGCEGYEELSAEDRGQARTLRVDPVPR